MKQPCPDSFRYIITTARRLDASHRIFEEVRSKLKNLEEENLGPFKIRNLLYEVVGAVELAIVSMYRAIDMASKLQKHFSVSAPFPTRVSKKLPHVKQLRDAYEHIDERALGLKKFHQKDPDALSVFEFKPLFEEGVVSYGNNSLDINTETTDLFLDVRNYLKTAAGELSSNSSTIT